MIRRILLVGMMGAGKTTTGQLVARRLGWGYRDSDADVEAATGLTVPELFARDGEAAFRRAEAAVLAGACADPEPSVVSVAGGAVLSPDNRRLIAASGTVVWLRAQPETLAARVGDGAGRPLLGDDPADGDGPPQRGAVPALRRGGGPRDRRRRARAPTRSPTASSRPCTPPALPTHRPGDPPRATRPSSGGSRPCAPSPSTWPNAPTRCWSGPGRATRSLASCRPAPGRR